MKNSINSIGTEGGYVVETENVPDRERKEQRLDVRAGLVAHASLLVLVQGDLGKWSTFLVIRCVTCNFSIDSTGGVASTLVHDEWVLGMKKGGCHDLDSSNDGSK